MKLLKDLKDMLLDLQLGHSLTNDWLTKRSEHYAAQIRHFITNNAQTSPLHV